MNINQLFSLGQIESISILGLLSILLLSLLAGLGIAWTYKKIFNGLSFSGSFVFSLIILPLITAAIILSIGNNLAGAFGLIGTLAIIRFRTPIKDPKDIVFIFLSLSIGVILGSSNLKIGIISLPLILLICLAINRFNINKSKKELYFLIIKQPKNSYNPTQIEVILDKFSKDYNLIKYIDCFDDETLTEITYKLQLIPKQEKISDLARALKNLNVINLSLLSMENYSEY